MRRLEIVLGDVSATAILLDEQAPKTCQALWDTLPITARAVNARWSGAALFFRHELGVDREIENETTFMPPGLIIYNPRHAEFSLSYGDAQYWEPVGPTYVTAVAKLDGDNSRFLEAVARLSEEGAGMITFRRK